MDMPMDARPIESMLRRRGPRATHVAAIAAWLLAAIGLCGCTSFNEYVHNGYKVGPNYCKPPAPVAEHWIDADDKRVRSSDEEPAFWWTVFKDPVLDQLICMSYHENLTLRTAGFRIFEARAELAIDTGNLFPQTQDATGSYTRNAVSKETSQRPVPFQAVLQPMELRLQPGLGARLLGPIPPGHRIRSG